MANLAGQPMLLQALMAEAALASPEGDDGWLVRLRACLELPNPVCAVMEGGLLRGTDPAGGG